MTGRAVVVPRSSAPPSIPSCTWQPHCTPVAFSVLKPLDIERVYLARGRELRRSRVHVRPSWPSSTSRCRDSVGARAHVERSRGAFPAAKFAKPSRSRLPFAVARGRRLAETTRIRSCGSSRARSRAPDCRCQARACAAVVPGHSLSITLPSASDHPRPGARAAGRRAGVVLDKSHAARRRGIDPSSGRIRRARLCPSCAVRAIDNPAQGAASRHRSRRAGGRGIRESSRHIPNVPVDLSVGMVRSASRNVVLFIFVRSTACHEPGDWFSRQPRRSTHRAVIASRRRLLGRAPPLLGAALPTTDPSPSRRSSTHHQALRVASYASEGELGALTEPVLDHLRRCGRNPVVTSGPRDREVARRAVRGRGDDLRSIGPRWPARRAAVLRR